MKKILIPSLIVWLAIALLARNKDYPAHVPGASQSRDDSTTIYVEDDIVDSSKHVSVGSIRANLDTSNLIVARRGEWRGFLTYPYKVRDEDVSLRSKNLDVFAENSVFMNNQNFYSNTISRSINSNKVAGVLFRADAGWADIDTLRMWHQLFNKYGFKVNWAFSVNGRDGWDAKSTEWQNQVREMQQDGHNVYSYPFSAQNYVTMYDTTKWKKSDGSTWVDGFQFVDRTNFANVTGFTEFNDSTGLRVAGQTVQFIAGTNKVLTDSLPSTTDLVYLYGTGVNDLNDDGTDDEGWYQVESVATNATGPDTVTVRFHFLYESNHVIFDDNSTINLYKGTTSDYEVYATEDGCYNALKEIVLFQQYCGLQRPNTYTNAGGKPQLHNTQVLAAGRKLGFYAVSDNGSEYPTDHGYNDPIGELAGYGWGWKNPLNTEQQTAATTIGLIADYTARHVVCVDGLHPAAIGTSYLDYFAKLDSVLHFLAKNNIPVGTFEDWTNTLYRVETDPGINIIPDITRDLDGDLYPDGYTGGYSAYLDSLDGVIETDSICFSHNVTATKIVDLYKLYGVEKGWTEFGAWTKGGALDSFQVEITQYDNNENNIGYLAFKLNADNSTWTFNKIAKAVNISKSCAFLHVEIKTDIQSAGTIKITGLSMKKSFTSGDDLGSHVATKNIALDDNYLSNDGSSEGLRVGDLGEVGINRAPVTNIGFSVENSMGNMFYFYRSGSLTMAMTADNSYNYFSAEGGRGVYFMSTGGRDIRFSPSGVNRFYKNLSLEGNFLSNDGGSSEGITINNAGNVAISAFPDSGKLVVFNDNPWALVLGNKASAPWSAIHVGDASFTTSSDSTRKENIAKHIPGAAGVYATLAYLDLFKKAPEADWNWNRTKIRRKFKSKYIAEWDSLKVVQRDSARTAWHIREEKRIDEIASRKHFGPMAQDVRAAFGPKAGDGKSINWEKVNSEYRRAVQEMIKLHEKDAKKMKACEDSIAVLRVQVNKNITQLDSFMTRVAKLEQKKTVPKGIQIKYNSDYQKPSTVPYKH